MFLYRWTVFKILQSLYTKQLRMGMSDELHSSTMRMRTLPYATYVEGFSFCLMRRIIYGFFFAADYSGTKICGADLKCYWESSRKLFVPEFSNEDEDIHALIDDCDCLPTCTQLTYAIHTTSLSGEAGETPMYISYKDPFFKKEIRSELHSLSEFFSSCGGSLGLFLGVSIFSIIELFYFCTVRLYLHSKRSGREKTPENTNSSSHL